MIKSFLGCSGLYVMVRKQKIWCLSSYACVLSHFSCGHLFAVLCIVAHQDPMSMGFSRQLYWSRLPLPPPGDLPDSAIESASLISPALAGRFFTAIAPPGKSLSFYVVVQLLSCVQLFVTQWTAAHNASLSLMYSAYKLNKQGDNIQPWYAPFLIWNQSVVPCPMSLSF